MKLHRDLNITQKSAWYLAHRLREGWKAGNGGMFTGPVEADETYIGGKRKNMPKAKRAKLIGARSGRQGCCRRREGSCHQPRRGPVSPGD